MVSKHKPKARIKTIKTKTSPKIKKKAKTKNKITAVLKIIFPIIIVVLALCVTLVLMINNKPSAKDYDIIHETKFGGVYIKSTIDDFNKLGFEYGDSVDVAFSNGYELLDIPYYNGYYVDINEPLLIAYPGYDYIKVGVNYGADLWLTANLTENDTASISLNERGKYLNIQKARDIHYTDTQGDISDVVFANFRNVKVGNLKENILYRSASPIDNSHNRAPVVDRLISNVGINYIINLSDDDTDLVEHINKEDFNSPYFLSLYNNRKVLPLSMSAQFKDQSFEQSLARGFTAMADNPGPYLIHCVEGKDRTGYVIMLLEALLGASYSEMVDDYMVTYDNYYGITKTSDPNRYYTIKEKNIDLMLHYIIDDENWEQDLTAIIDFSPYTKNYLLSIGMNEPVINQLIQNLSI